MGAMMATEPWDTVRDFYAALAIILFVTTIEFMRLCDKILYWNYLLSTELLTTEPSRIHDIFYRYNFKL